MHTLSCSDALERLPLHVGGDLDPDVLDLVARHLETCAACRAEAERAAGARDRLVGAFRDEVEGGGPNLWPGVRAALLREGLLRRPPRRLRRVGMRLAAAAAAAAALVLAPRLLDLSGGGTPAPAAPAVVVERPIPVAPPAVADPGPAVARTEPERPVAEPRSSGLVPVSDASRRLSTQVGPDFHDVYSLTSSPIR